MVLYCIIVLLFDKKYRKLNEKQMEDNVQGSLVSFVELVGGIVILWVGGYAVIKGDMTMGREGWYWRISQFRFARGNILP